MAAKLQHEELSQKDVIAIGLELLKELYKCKDEDMPLNNYRLG